MLEHVRYYAWAYGISLVGLVAITLLLTLRPGPTLEEQALAQENEALFLRLKAHDILLIDRRPYYVDSATSGGELFLRSAGTSGVMRRSVSRAKYNGCAYIHISQEDARYSDILREYVTGRYISPEILAIKR